MSRVANLIKYLRCWKVLLKIKYLLKRLRFRKNSQKPLLRTPVLRTWILKCWESNLVLRKEKSRKYLSSYRILEQLLGQLVP
jgi:hypothetical protein